MDKIRPLFQQTDIDFGKRSGRQKYSGQRVTFPRRCFCIRWGELTGVKIRHKLGTGKKYKHRGL